MDRLVAGIEMGGTKCVLLLARGPDDIVDRVVLPTGLPDPTFDSIALHLDRWHREGPFDAIGIAAFGPLRLDPARDDYGSIGATTKPGWHDTDVYHRFGARFGVPVGLQSDVTAAAIAEGRWGAARGLANHAYVTIGTGVGVGAVVDGRALAGTASSEIGHIRVTRAPGDVWAGACAYHGDCVEGLISGPALAARHGAPAEDIPVGSPDWRLFEHTLTGLLHALVLMAGPDRIAIGGGVVARRADLFPGLRDALAASLNQYGMTTGFVADVGRRLGPPGLGTMAGPLGAIAVGLAAVDS